MDANQELAFRSARYRMADPKGAWLLQPDCHSPPLSRLLTRSGLRCASLLTACNPAAVPLPDEANERRQARLRECVQALGLSFLEGQNSAPDGSWREPSLLCLGMTLPVALELARDFGQVAILYAGPDAIPRLYSCQAFA